MSERELVKRVLDIPKIIEIASAISASMTLIGIALGIFLYPVLSTFFKKKPVYVQYAAWGAIAIAIICLAIIVWKNRRYFLNR